MNTEVSPATSQALAVLATIAGGVSGIWSQRGSSHDCDPKCGRELRANDKAISVSISSTVDIIVYFVCLNALLVGLVLIALWRLRARAPHHHDAGSGFSGEASESNDDAVRTEGAASSTLPNRPDIVARARRAAAHREGRISDA